MKLLSVNVGQPRENPWKAIKLTGIDKRPVDGPVMVTPPRAEGMGMVGLAGDRVYDVREHGGPGSGGLRVRPGGPGLLGGRAGPAAAERGVRRELTTEGMDCNGALVGERWRVGPAVVLEATAPRIPCGTFQGWLARGWIKRFALAGLPGAYFRVIEPGEIQAGDEIEIVHRPDHDVTVALTFRALLVEPDLLPRLLAADALPRELKEMARRRIT